MKSAHAPESDFAFLVGRWTVRHQRLKERLTGCTDWEHFSGTTELWPTMAGLGNVDDNIVDLPAGSYRAMTVRAFDAATRQWAIWWLDLRNPSVIEPPVYGWFEGEVGTFVGDSTLRGAPIKVRFQWLDTASGAPRWEQAFSPDGGETWETNWVMRFSRA